MLLPALLATKFRSYLKPRSALPSAHGTQDKEPLQSKGFPDSSVGKESAWKAGNPSSIPRLGRSPGEGIGYSLQYSWASLVAQLVKDPLTMWETGFHPWVGKIPWRRERLPTPVFWPGEFHGLYSWWIAMSQTQLNNFHFTSLHFRTSRLE